MRFLYCPNKRHALEPVISYVQVLAAIDAFILIYLFSVCYVSSSLQFGLHVLREGGQQTRFELVVG